MSVAQVWVAALVTLGIWTWLYDRKNPIFDLVQYLYIALSLAYGAALAFSDYIRPVFLRLVHGEWWLAIPFLIGLLLYTRYLRGWQHVSDWSVSFFVGYGAGYVLAFSPAVLLGQVSASFVHLWGSQSLGTTIDNWILVLCLMAALAYFLFTVDRRRPLVRATTAVGRWAIMLALGTGFGSQIINKYSLQFGRVYFLFHNWLHIV